MAEIVLGIDGGGTHTRVVVADVSGRILATARAGGASPHKTTSAEANVQSAIHEAVSKAGHTLEEVVQLVAGLAGLDDPEDHLWAEKLTAVPGLECPRLHVNDAVVAHAGALQSQPGIIVISGTGSIIFAVTELGRQIRNYDFHQYAHSAARHLSYEAVYRMLAEDIQPEDNAFIGEVLAFWQVESLAELRERGTMGFVTDEVERMRLFGEMAPLVTASAQKGVPLARTVCDIAIDALGTGIRLLGSCFTRDTVPVALIGSVVQSEYIKQSLKSVLAKSVNRSYEIIDSAFPSEVGAVILALGRHGIVINTEVLSLLKASQE